MNNEKYKLLFLVTAANENTNLYFSFFTFHFSFIIRFLLSLKALHLHSEFLWDNGIEENADDGSEGKTRNRDRTDADTTLLAILHTYRNNEDESRYEYVS